MVRNALVALLAFGAAATPATLEEEAVIAHRRQVMRTMGELASGLTMSLRLQVSDEHIVMQVRSLHRAAKEVHRAFEPKVVGDGSEGSARAEIWINWPDFANRIDAQLVKLAALEKAAVAGGSAMVGPMLRSSLDCRACHDIYRVPEK